MQKKSDLRKTSMKHPTLPQLIFKKDFPPTMGSKDSRWIANPQITSMSTSNEEQLDKLIYFVIL